jgi:hypothetical protein
VLVRKFETRVEQRSAARRGRGIHQRVDAAEGLDRATDECPAVVGQADVGADEDTVAAEFDDLFCSLLALLFVAAADGDVRRAFANQTFGDFEAEPLGAARDQGVRPGVSKKIGVRYAVSVSLPVG